MGYIFIPTWGSAYSAIVNFVYFEKLIIKDVYCIVVILIITLPPHMGQILAAFQDYFYCLTTEFKDKIKSNLEYLF